MKKFLSLVLALVMTMSLVTVSAGAKDFGDSADLSGEAYEEAVNVMSEMGIIDGYSDGDFRPQGTLTRQAAAKIIACMMLGKTTAESLGTQAAPFKDVPAGSSFAGYIAFCVERGLISGYADGTFRPTGTLTGFAFLKMLLGALGYDQSIEGYTGTNWTVNVAGRAYEIGLTDGNDEFVGSKACTREEAALYAVNTLKSTLVEYANKGSSITINGIEVVQGASEPTYITSSIAGAATSIDDTRDNYTGDYTVEFAERYQPDLELDATTDAFGRPSHTWSWKSDEIGTYVDYDKMVAEYTTEVTGKDLYDQLGKTVVDDYDFYIYINGVTDSKIDDDIFTKDAISRNNQAGVGDTGNGVLTQVFVDPNAGRDGEVTIAIINTYLAKADDDYDERHDDVSLTIYDLDKVGNEYVKADVNNNSETLSVSGDDFDIADVAKGDFFLVTVADGAVQTMDVPEILSGVEITAFSKNKNLTVDGTKYDYATTAEYEFDTLDQWTGENNNGVVNLKDRTYNVYLDQYGYVIGAEEVDVPDNYLFITGLNGNYDNLANVTYEANAIFLDGTMETITINAKKSDFKGNQATTILKGSADDATVNRWFTYTVNNSDVYTVELVDIDAGLNKVGQNHAPNRANVIDYKNDSASDGQSNKVYGTDDTVYLTASVDTIKTAYNRTDVVIDGVDSVAVGIDNVDIDPWATSELAGKGYTASSGKLSSGIYTLYDEDGYIIAMVAVGEDNGNSNSLVYVHSGSVSEERYNKTTGEWTWTRTAIQNGEEVTLTEVDDSGISMLNKMDEDQWYMVRFNADGEVVTVTAAQTGIDADADFNNWGLSPTSTPTAYVEDHDNGAINKAINKAGVDTVLYHQMFGNVHPSNSGKTLYMTQDHNSYIRYTDDTKVVFEQMNNNDWDTDFWAGETGVERALRELRVVGTDGSGNDLYSYTISAVIDDGRASSIIIKDTSVDGYQPARPSSDGTANGTVKLDGLTLKVYVRQDKSVDVLAAAENYFKDANITSIRANGTEYDLTVGNRTYTTKTITLAPVSVVIGSGTPTPSTVYLAEGETVTVAVTYAAGWDTLGVSSGLTATDSNDPAGNISYSKITVSSDQKTATFTMTAKGDMTGAYSTSITFQ